MPLTLEILSIIQLHLYMDKPFLKCYRHSKARLIHEMQKLSTAGTYTKLIVSLFSFQVKRMLFKDDEIIESLMKNNLPTVFSHFLKAFSYFNQKYFQKILSYVKKNHVIVVNSHDLRAFQIFSIVHVALA